MTAKIYSQRWTEGFQDAYAELPPDPLPGDDDSYAAGRIEGEALRIKHRQEFGEHLFGSRLMPPPLKTPT